jgi:bifunctional non-homologous end joining protein LigD
MPARKVTITHPERVYFPSGYTKADMIRYYTAVAPVMLPHLRGRPVTLVRFPTGVGGETFYEKNVPRHAPAWIRTAPVARRRHAGVTNYLLVNHPETLAWCANRGAIEFHPFLHEAGDPERPTHLAFDLDPGDGANLLDCIAVAEILHGLFARLGLQCFPKVSGSKGLQIYVPLNTKTSYAVTSPFAQAVAELLAREFPRQVVSKMSKALRRGRVLIDWSQNSPAKTTVCAYSLRGKRDEPFVSAPVTWQELRRAAKKKDIAALSFSPQAVLRRIRSKGDLFAPVLHLKQKLPRAATGRAATTSAKHPLGHYAAKRDFSQTSEPGAGTTSPDGPGGERRFVIQKHAARRLHFDFRLELDATLKSWAVPKGLPYTTGIRRAAFQVEDHPLEYMNFEGTIPPGQYGGGTVMVWDTGTYEVIGGSLEEGDLKLRLHGRKLKGEWHLFRIKSDPKKPVWLIVKSGRSMKPLSRKAEETSVHSGRTLAGIARAEPAPRRGQRIRSRATARTGPKTARGQPPAFVAPMKPQLVAALPDGNPWSYEVKWDGYRALLGKHGPEVWLWSRSGRSLAGKFPDIARDGGTLQAGSCLLDGEIVALDPHGRPSFQALQNRASTDHAIVFYAFDLLALDGKDLRSEPLRMRRRKLREVLTGSTLRLSSELPGSARDVLAAVHELGLEGVVAKRLDSPYRAGDRSADWQKVRLRRGQEFVVGGYRPGMHPFESILVGHYEGRKLLFAGKVRAGFTPATRAAMWELLEPDEIADCPFANLPEAARKGRWGEGITNDEMKTLRWVRPRHVVDVEFAEWTAQHHLRHAAFRGLRPDKVAREVHREVPAAPEGTVADEI